MASRKTGTKKKNSKKSKGGEEFTLRSDIVLLLVIAASVIIFICLIGQGGLFGTAISAFFFGAIGLMAYVFPFWLFFFCAFLVANRRNRSGKLAMKSMAAVLLLVFLSVLVHLLMYGEEELPLLDLMRECIETKNGGGLVGGCVAYLFIKTLGVASAYVITIIVLIIAVILLTQRSLFGGLKKIGEKARRAAGENAGQRRDQKEARASRRAEREEQRLKEEEEREREEERKKEKHSTECRGGSGESGQVHGAEYAAGGVAFGATALKAGRKKAKASAEDMSEIELPWAAGPSEAVCNGADYSAGNESFDGQEELPFEEAAGSGDCQQGDFPSAGEEKKNSASSRKSRHSDSAQGEKKKKSVEKFIDGGENMEIENSSGAAAADQAAVFSELPEPEIHISNEVSSEGEDAFAADGSSESGGGDVPCRSKVKTAAAAAGAAAGMEAAASRLSAVQASSDISAQEEKRDDTVQKEEAVYQFPPADLLAAGDPNASGDSRSHLAEMSKKLQQTLKTFGVDARVTNVTCGPSVTRYEIQPEMGVKVSKVVGLADDIKLNLAVTDIRIEAPIPGKSAIGIEVPNRENVTVALRDLIESEEFIKSKSKLTIAVGKDIAGKNIVADIAKMPHLLIAGATGSGKSVCINTIIMSILYKAAPEEVKLILIDPKVVELSVYNGIPHLYIPVVTDPKKAAGALNWAVAEMTDRYQKFAECNVRDIKGYNKKIDALHDMPEEDKPKKMPQVVIIVDELADLMMVCGKDVETSICRLAQLARAAGIHLIIATQRPSVNVITGLIKANMPSRIAFAVTSGVDSRVILDMNGAEKLLGKGDMLFYPQGYSRPLRVQGAFVSDSEVSDVVEFLTQNKREDSYDAEIEEKVQSAAAAAGGGGFSTSSDDRDAYFADAGRFVIEKEKGSIGMLQRMFKIGFNRAARIMDQLEEAGVVGPEDGTKPRTVLMSAEEFEQYLSSQQN